MQLNTIKFICRVILAEVLLFCLFNPNCALSDTEVHTRGVTLAWDANLESELAAYYLYYKIDSPDNSPELIKVDPNVTNYTIDGLDYNKTYVFWVTAYDTAGLESDRSNEVTLCRTCYRDKDGDSYGDFNVNMEACSCPQGYVENFDDCDDSDGSVTDVYPEHVKPGESIQTAIDAAHDGDVIIIHSGIYKENINFRGKALTVKSTNPDDPNIVANTVIDGSRAGSVIIFNSGEESHSVLNGVTVRNGDACFGGGIYCEASSLTINKCTISENSARYGGGIWCVSSSVTINGCTIDRNSAMMEGGGIYCLLSSPLAVTNCIINGNSAMLSAGGIYCLLSSANISNTTIYGNKISSDGGGIYSLSSNLNITNCIISKNSSNFGGGISCDNYPLTITNCLFWENLPGDIFNNITNTFPDINDGYTDNIEGNPSFVNPGNGNFHLKSLFSPCIDAGTGTGAPNADKDGHPRPVGNGYDIGAYEFGS